MRGSGGTHPYGTSRPNGYGQYARAVAWDRPDHFADTGADCILFGSAALGPGGRFCQYAGSACGRFRQPWTRRDLRRRSQVDQGDGLQIRYSSVRIRPPPVFVRRYRQLQDAVWFLRSRDLRSLSWLF
jgi:hypothetical protein